MWHIDMVITLNQFGTRMFDYEYIFPFPFAFSSFFFSFVVVYYFFHFQITIFDWIFLIEFCSSCRGTARWWWHAERSLPRSCSSGCLYIMRCVCVCVCACMYVCVCVWVCLCAFACACECACLRVLSRALIPLHVFVLVCFCCVQMFVRLRAYLCMCLCVRLRAYVC